MKRCSIALAGAVVAFAICSAERQASAQPPGGPGSMFARLDANGNGTIEPSEVPDRFRPFFERMAERAGLDPRKPIKIDQLRKAMEQNRPSFGGRGGDRDRRDWGRRGDDRQRDEERRKQEQEDDTGVPGFGVEQQEVAPVLGFGAAFDAESDDAMLQKKYTDDLLREVDRTIARYDKNKNGILDQTEWKDVRWRSDPRASDTNGDGRLTRAEFAARIAGFWGSRALRDGGDSSRSSSSFSRSSSSRSSSSGSRSSSSTRSDREKYRKFAESVMKQYDKNKNRVLDKGEAGKWIRADKNGNGQVTLDELAGWLSTYQRSGFSSAGRSSTGSTRRSAGTSEFYRYRSPHERLPSGLPSWFKEKDKNADGQVAMAEYATVWSDETIDEFNRYDHNGDGIITPAETLKPREEKSRSAFGQRSGEKPRGDRPRGDSFGRRRRR